MASFDRIVRRLRHGKPIVVVSGLPRSGTSMAMKMLEAGGLPLLTDGVRSADVSNPKGYYEFEPVKNLDKGGDLRWLNEARGHGVKIISFLLTYLPETYDYKVVFMQRDLGEAVASQRAMLRERQQPQGETSDDQLQSMYEQHLEQVARFLRNRRCFETLRLGYGEVLDRPQDAARRIAEFVGGPLDVGKMATVADPALYRNRRPVEV